MSTTSSYSSVIVSSSPKEYFQLGETSGTTATDSASGGNGTYANVTLGQSGPTLEGAATLAPRWAGSSSGTSVNMGVSVPQPAATSSWTMEDWVFPSYASSTNSYNAYLSIWGYDYYHRLLLSNTASGGHLLAQFNGSFTSKRTLSGGTWHLIDVVYTGGKMSYYIDGTLDSSSSVSSSQAALAKQYWIGQYSTNQYYKFSGKIAQHAFYASALGSTVIAQHWAAASVTAAASPAPTATPTTAPTANPTVAPTATPTSTSTAYFYHGCQVYPAGDTYANNDIYNATPSANSAAIASNWAAVGNFDYGDTASSEAANLATSSTPLQTVQYAGGHNPPMTNGAGTQVPWQNGYYIEGTYGQNSDAHSQILNTQTCEESEMYGTKWNGSTLGAYGGMNVSLKSSYASQYSLMGPVTVAYVPIMGFTDYGEDASLTSINHPLSFFAPSTSGAKISKYGYYYPSHNGYVSVGSCTGSNNCLHLGDYIRLKASFNCGAYTRIGQLVCNQLKHYGAVFDDDAYHLGFRFGLSSNGSNPWNYSTNLQPLFKALTMQDFDVIEKGSLHCSGSPCV